MAVCTSHRPALSPPPLQAVGSARSSAPWALRWAHSGDVHRGGQFRRSAGLSETQSRPSTGRNEWTQKRSAKARALGSAGFAEDWKNPPPAATRQSARTERSAPAPAAPSANERGPADFSARSCSHFVRQIKFFRALNFFFKAPAAVPAAADESGRVSAPPLPVPPPGAGAAVRGRVSPPPAGRAWCWAPGPPRLSRGAQVRSARPRGGRGVVAGLQSARLPRRCCTRRAEGGRRRGRLRPRGCSRAGGVNGTGRGAGRAGGAARRSTSRARHTHGRPRSARRRGGAAGRIVPRKRGAGRRAPGAGPRSLARRGGGSGTRTRQSDCDRHGVGPGPDAVGGGRGELGSCSRGRRRGQGRAEDILERSVQLVPGPDPVPLVCKLGRGPALGGARFPPLVPEGAGPAPDRIPPAREWVWVDRRGPGRLRGEAGIWVGMCSSCARSRIGW